MGDSGETPRQMCSSRDLRLAPSAFCGNLLETKVRPHPRSNELGTLGLKPSYSYFNKPSRWSLRPLKVGSCSSRKFPGGSLTHCKREPSRLGGRVCVSVKAGLHQNGPQKSPQRQSPVLGQSYEEKPTWGYISTEYFIFPSSESPATEDTLLPAASGF